MTSRRVVEVEKQVEQKSKWRQMQLLGGGTMWHVTVRMAWHDNSWDGHVCNDPVANTYCTGNHSLLSDRLAREKNAALEQAGTKIDAAMPNYPYSDT